MAQRRTDKSELRIAILLESLRISCNNLRATLRERQLNEAECYARDMGKYIKKLRGQTPQNSYGLVASRIFFYETLLDTLMWREAA